MPFFASVDVNLSTSSALTEEEIFAGDKTDDVTSAEELNDESDLTHYDPMKNNSLSFFRLGNT